MKEFKKSNFKEHKNKSGIYFIKIAHHSYIGSSITLQRRLCQHLNKLSSQKHENDKMQKTFNKYSSECSFSILEYCNPEERLTKEKEWMDKLSPNLNLKLDPVTQNNCITQSKVVYQYTLDGTLINEYVSVSEAERATGISGSSIASNARGKVLSAGKFLWSYTKKKCNYVNNSNKAVSKAVTMYDYTGKKIKRFESIADAARYIQEKNDNFDSLCACISGVAKGKGKLVKEKYRYSYEDLNTLSTLILQKNFKINQYDLEGKLIKKWESVVNASESLSISANCIRRVISGERKTYKGFIWKKG